MSSSNDRPSQTTQTTETTALALSSNWLPSDQETIKAVTVAAEIAFGIQGGYEPTIQQTANICVAIAAFLKAAEAGSPRSLTEWRIAIENLVIKFR